MQEPIWNNLSKEHLQIHTKNMKESGGYCLHCQKPLVWNKHYLCPSCLKNLSTNGSEHRRVGYKTVGEATVNYQQSIHRRFFKCNAPYKYRGIFEQRIKTNIKQETINKSANKLHHSLLNLPDCELRRIYIKIQDMRNTQRRLLYAVTLYAISYYIEKIPSFKHSTHYQASIVAQLENDIKRMYIRTHYDTYEKLESKWSRSLTLSKKLYTIITECTNPILLEIYT